MHKLTIAAAAAVFLAGCSGEAPTQQNETAPATLAPGQYQASWTVSQLRSVDKTTPATNLKEGATGATTGCIGAENAIDPVLFAEDGDSCTASNAYIRGGRISVDLSCRREGSTGEVRQSVNGTYTADGLEAEVTTTTYLSSTGDYAMTRAFTAKRIGECPPAVAEEKAS